MTANETMLIIFAVGSVLAIWKVLSEQQVTNGKSASAPGKPPSTGATVTEKVKGWWKEIKLPPSWLFWIIGIAITYCALAWWLNSQGFNPWLTYLLPLGVIIVGYPIIGSFGDSKEKRYQDIKQMLLILLGVLAVILVGAMAWSALKPHMAESNTGVVIVDEPVYIPDSEDFILIETGRSVYVTLNPGQRSKRVLVSKRSFLASYMNVPTDTRVDQIAYDMGRARTHQATAGVDNDVGSCEWVVFVNKSAIRFTMQIYIP